MDFSTDLDRDACYRALLARDARFDGRFFTGVTTTGIYCRPICPARPPKLAHCLFFASAAAAAAAGFRPCLRCRPEASPDLAAWRGTSNTVARALALIAEGALDDGDGEALATRLGLGERHLRRLFRQHLGATATAVAQTRRLLFAKKLISETTLPMAEVALASGFGSVRRFNDAIRRLYGRAPGELRRGKTAPSAPEKTVLTLTLPFTPPYDWEAMIGFLAARAMPGVEAVEGGRYRRSIELAGAHGTVEVRAVPGASHLLAAIRFPAVTDLPSIVMRLRRVFDLGADPAAIAAQLAADTHLAPLVAARPGLRVPGSWDGFEIAVRAVLGQQVSVARARELAGRLVAAYGETLTISDAALRFVFPRPARLADADIAATLGMPRARAGAISALARAAAEDPRLFDPAPSLDHAVERLKRLSGIGDWTAHYIAMRALGEPDAFPTGDIGLLRAMATPAGRPTPSQLLAQAETWRPWRAYAALHLWTADAAAPQPETTDGSALEPPRLAARNAAARL
jgi:AraC family transcriptional regulator of adaptative response / DNA-3-methyladenine glycosylase II